MIRKTARVPMPGGNEGRGQQRAQGPRPRWVTAATATSGIPTRMIATCTKSTATTPHIPLITFEKKITAPMTSTACVYSKPKPASTEPRP